MLLNNARAMVDHHNPETREVRFDARPLTFAQYWRFKLRACAPYRAWTKVKDERGLAA